MDKSPTLVNGQLPDPEKVNGVEQELEHKAHESGINAAFALKGEWLRVRVPLGLTGFSSCSHQSRTRSDRHGSLPDHAILHRRCVHTSGH